MRSTADRTAYDEDEEAREGKIELSGAQVAGGAAATMVAAFLASSLGVYGTIVGAGVVSVGATAGGAIFQHVFRRTGRQLKEAAVAAPKALHKQSASLHTSIRNDTDKTQLLPIAAPAADDETQLLPTARPYGLRTTHGTRMRGRRRLALVAAGTFLAVMAVVFGIEKLTGGPLSNVWGDDRTGTSFSPGERKSDTAPADDGDGGSTDDAPESGSEETGESGKTGETGASTGTGSDENGQPGDATTPEPGAEDRPAPGTGGDGGMTPTPTPTPTPTSPGTGEGGQETPDPGESPAAPQQDGVTTPETATP